MATATKNDSMPEMPNGQILSVKTFPSIEDAASIVPEETYAQLPSTPSVVKVYETLLWLALHSPSGRLVFSQHALAAHLGCKQASISRAIGMLEQDGFIIIERGARGAANVYSLPDTRKKRSICAPESRITSRITLSHGVIPSDTQVIPSDTNPSSEGVALFTSKTFPEEVGAEGITCVSPHVSPLNQGDTMPSTCGNAADDSEKTNDGIYNKIKESKKNLLFPAENEDPRFPYPDVEEARNLTKSDIRYLSKMIDDAHEAGDIYAPLACRARALLICYICTNFWERDPMAELDMLRWQDDPEGYDSRIQSCLAENMLRWCRKLTADERAVFDRIREIWPQRCYGPEVIAAERGFATEIMRGTTAEEIYELAMWYLERYQALNGRANTRDDLSHTDGSAYFLREWLTNQKHGLAATRSHVFMESMGGSRGEKPNRERSLLKDRDDRFIEKDGSGLGHEAAADGDTAMEGRETVSAVRAAAGVNSPAPAILPFGSLSTCDFSAAADVPVRPEVAPEPYWWSIERLDDGGWVYIDRHDKVTQTCTPLSAQTKTIEKLEEAMPYAAAAVGREKTEPAYCISTPEGIRARNEWLARKSVAEPADPAPMSPSILDFRPEAAPAAMIEEADEEPPSMRDLFAGDIARMGVEVA